jgi:hypothetical protein
VGKEFYYVLIIYRVIIYRLFVEALSRGLYAATGRGGTIFSSVKVRLNNLIYKINK